MPDLNVGPIAGRQVLVTGAGGFLGSRLVERVAKAGASVHAVSRRHRSDEDVRITWHSVDLSDHAKTDALVRSVRPDVVFHLASLVTGSRDHRLLLPTMRDNLNSTVHLLNSALQTRPSRIVLAGSIEEPVIDDEVASSPYAATKLVATTYARMCHALWDLPVTVLRIAMVYGPGLRDVNKLVPHVVLAMLQGRAAKLTSGVRGLDWIYVDDVVDAFIAAAERPGAAGHVIPIGSGESISIRDTVALIGKLVTTDFPEPEFGVIADRKLDLDRVAESDTAGSILGWHPRVGLEDGMRQTIQWYQDQLALGRFGGARAVQPESAGHQNGSGQVARTDD